MTLMTTYNVGCACGAILEEDVWITPARTIVFYWGVRVDLTLRLNIIYV
jgi:hypothetical protein